MTDYNTEAFEWCTPKEPQKPKRRKLNFNVVWFTLGWVAGMLVTLGLYNISMIMG